MTTVCLQTRSGHCNHAPDGSMFMRHNQRPVDSVVDITCCWCGHEQQTAGYSAKQDPPKAAQINPNTPHGEFLPGDVVDA